VGAEFPVIDEVLERVQQGENLCQHRRGPEQRAGEAGLQRSVMYSQLDWAARA